MFRNRKEIDNHMYEACKSSCHEWTSKDEVENNKEDIVVEKKGKILKRKIENKEILKERKKMKK